MLAPIRVHLLQIIKYNDQKFKQFLDVLHPWSMFKHFGKRVRNGPFSITLSYLNEKDKVHVFLFLFNVGPSRWSLFSYYFLLFDTMTWIVYFILGYFDFLEVHFSQWGYNCLGEGGGCVAGPTFFSSYVWCR